MRKPKAIEPIGNAPHAWQGPFPLKSTAETWPTDPGIYRVRLKINSAFVLINRIGADDPEGILYIGRAKEKPGLQSRLEELRKAWTSDADRYLHGSATRFFRNRRLIQKYPNPEIVVEYKTTQRFNDKAPEWRAAKLPTETIADDAAVIEERSALWTYEQQFGELPPLNSRGGDHLR